MSIAGALLGRLCRPWDLVDDDHAQGPALHRQLVLVARGVPIVAPCRDAAPVVHCVPINLRRHGVLKRQANELNAVLPTEAFLHQLSHPSDHSAFARAREPVHYV